MKGKQKSRKDKNDKNTKSIEVLVLCLSGILLIELSHLVFNSQKFVNNRSIRSVEQNSILENAEIQNDEITVENLEIFADEIHASDRVKAKLRKKRELYDIDNWNKLGKWRNDISELHETMNREHLTRVSEAAEFLDKNAMLDPAQWPDGECEFASSEEAAIANGGSYCAKRTQFNREILEKKFKINTRARYLGWLRQNSTKYHPTHAKHILSCARAEIHL